MITFVYSYYNNGNMLLEHQKYWNKYPDEIKEQLEIIITDDCSKVPAKDFIQKSDLDLKLYRIKIDIPWNWLACRNIGAHYAENKWILMTDIDHLVDKKTIKKLYSKNDLNEKNIYLFNRKDAPNLTPYKPHDDSYFMTKKMFWKIGGYDETLSGFYGTSGSYRKRAEQISPLIRFKSLYLIRYPANVIWDANTKGLKRKDSKRKELIKPLMKLKTENNWTDIKVLSFPYERVI